MKVCLCLSIEKQKGNKREGEPESRNRIHQLQHFDFRICIEKIWGVGKRLSIFLHKHGIHTAKDLKNVDLKWIQKKINITAKQMVEELRGIPCMDIESKAKNKNF